MKEVLEALKKVVPMDFHWEEDFSKVINLREEDSQTSCELVVLRKKPSQETFTIQPDCKGTNIYDQLKLNLSSEQRCDYIVFCAKKTTLFVLLIEMKSKSSGGWLNQVRQGELIAKHCLEQVEKAKSINVLGNSEFRAILFRESVTKHATPRFKPEQPPSIQWSTDNQSGLQYVTQSCKPNLPIELGMYLK